MDQDPQNTDKCGPTVATYRDSPSGNALGLDVERVILRAYHWTLRGVALRAAEINTVGALGRRKLFYSNL
jgi:hypothetical protein